MRQLAPHIPKGTDVFAGALKCPVGRGGAGTDTPTGVLGGMHSPPRPVGKKGLVYAATFSAKPRELPFFRWISSSEMVAGVMPDRREAWPRVSGRYLLKR